MKASRSFVRACAWCGRSAGSFLLWTFWLGLVAMLAVQIHIVSTRQLPVPDFVLRRVERQIAESGFRVTFSRTSFDPSGRVLIEDVRLSLPEYDEPVINAGAVYVHLNPWWLTLGEVEPREIRVTDASLIVPAMLSPSGQAQALVERLEATFLPHKRQVVIRELSTRVAGVGVSARGAVSLVRRPVRADPRPLAEIIATEFPRWCRRALAFAEQIEGFEAPSLLLELAPSEDHVALIEGTLSARTLNLNTPIVAQARGLRLVTRAPLLGATPATSRLEFAAEELHLPLKATAFGVRAALLGQFQPEGVKFAPEELLAHATRLEGSGFFATAASIRVVPQPLPGLRAEIFADVMGERLAVEADANLETRAATLRFTGGISPRILEPIGALVRADIRRFFEFATLDCERGEARLGPDWKFQQLTARVALRNFRAHRVAMDEGRATVEVDRTRLIAPEAFVRLGDNLAAGSYEHDFRSREFRFLLDGRLRPRAISGLFREWWDRFFQQFEFRATPPVASVDVRGVWREGWRTSVFVAADAAEPVIRGGGFDRVRTRLFVRPGFVDALAIDAVRGDGLARGTFTYAATPGTNVWRQLDLDLVSSVELSLAGKITPPTVTQLLERFEFARPPSVRLKGRIENTVPTLQQQWNIEATSTGAFKFNGFPLSDVAFTATVRDDEILLDRIAARLGGGEATGRAKIWGVGNERRVGFDLAVKAANLGDTAAALQQYTAARQNRAPDPPGKYVKEKAKVRLDLAASAEGLYADPFSYRGDGNAVLEGADIGEVPLLGLLSELLRFTALRFTSARGNFKIDGARLAFSELNVRGSDAAIDAHGDYWLNRGELDFKAKLFPFQESGNLIKTVVGAVLSPISNVFEVKLTGTLSKPEWAFVIGPTNLLRSLAPEAPGTQSAPADQNSPEPSADATAREPAPAASPDADSARSEDATPFPTSSREADEAIAPSPSTPRDGTPIASPKPPGEPRS